MALKYHASGFTSYSASTHPPGSNNHCLGSMDVILSIKEYGGAGSLAMNLSLSNGLYLFPNAFEGFPDANSAIWLRSNMAGRGMLDSGWVGAEISFELECWILDVIFDFS